MADDDEEPPQGVTVCVRLRPMFVTRPDGSPAREATCTRVVEMEGRVEKGCGCAVTKIYDPNDMQAKPREYAFDRSYWSCDGFKEDPERPGFNIPDGPGSKYVSQDMVWNDVGNMIMRNALKGYNCTVFAYGQSGSGKSYSVVGYPPNLGIIPNTISSLYAVVDGNTDENVRYQVEIAMLEVYMDEVYDLLEPRKKERQKLNVFINKGEVFIYDPKDRKNMDKIWRAAKDKGQAEAFRTLGDANRSVRPTGMNPSSSRGHTIFMCRFRKEAKQGSTWVEQLRSKLSLVDLAGSERAHDTGLTGIGLEEGIAINQSLTMLGQVLQSLCKGERVNYRDKLTQLLAESLSGTAVTVMIAALSPADINYNDTVSTLRFADNAKKMPVKVMKQLDPTAVLINDLKEENERLKKQIEVCGGGGAAEEALKQREGYDAKLAEADRKIAEMQKAYAEMEAKAQTGGRVRIASLPFKVEDTEKLAALDTQITQLRQDVEAGNRSQEELAAKLAERAAAEAEAVARAEESVSEARGELQSKATELQANKQEATKQAQALDAEIAELKQVVASMAAQGQEAVQEKAKMEQLVKKSAEQEVAKQAAQAESKRAFEKILEARLVEYERALQRRRDAAALQAESSQGLGVPEDVHADRAAAVSVAEEATAMALQELKNMEPQASELNLLHRFRAALLELDHQESEARVKGLHAQLARLQTDTQSVEEQRRIEAEERVAMQQASKAAEEARAAAEAALQEKMLELQALLRERDDARSEALDVRDQMSDQDELRERQAAIEAIIATQNQSWEEKLAKSVESEKQLKKSFEDCGLSVGEMVSIWRGQESDDKDGQMMPHLVNLCEDAHEDGLVYLIMDGTTKVKRYMEEDAEPGIKLYGASVHPHHATFDYNAELGALNLTAACEPAVVWVNGEALKFGAAPMLLRHGARIIFGNEFVFRYVDPKAKKIRKTDLDEKGKPVLVDWQYAMDELAKKNGVDGEAELNRVRESLQVQFKEREMQLAEEQQVLERRMRQERDTYEVELKALREAAVSGTAKDYQAVLVKEQEQAKTQAALANFRSRSAAKEARAQWVRSALRTAKDESFELDIRLCRRQMADSQPRLVEANRIATLHHRKVRYSFHCLDAVDPRSRYNSNHKEAKIVAGLTFGLGVAGGLVGAVGGAIVAGPVGMAAGGAAGAQAAAVAGTVAASAVAAGAVAGLVTMAAEEGLSDESVMPRRLLLQIKVEHLESGALQLWPQQKFMDRFVKMLSFASGQAPDTFFDDEDARYEDIFWDEMDHTLVGTAAIGLTPLLRLANVKESVTLRDAWGEVKGVLEVNMSMKPLTDGILKSWNALTSGAGGANAQTPSAAKAALKNTEVKGFIRFNRLTFEKNCDWAGLFVRFSWFDTHGRLQHESEVVDGLDLEHTFDFKHKCTDDFLKFVEQGVVAIQIRAYECGKVKDQELRDLRMKLRKAEAELSQLRTSTGTGAKKLLRLSGGGDADDLQVELAKARDDAANAAKETQELKRALDLAEKQLVGKAPLKQNDDGPVLRRRVEELEGQLREAQAADGNGNKGRTKSCTVS